MAKRKSKRSARKKGESFQGCRKRLMKAGKKPGAASKACARPKGKKRKAAKRRRKRARK